MSYIKKLFFFYLTIACSFNSYSQNFEFEDKVYSSNIKTVQLYKDDGSEQSVLNSAVTTLDFNSPLVLEFDEISDKGSYFYTKIIHCNSDWSKSSLADPEFLYEYNEVLIENYAFSYSTKTNYTHYKYELPKVKFSGNYLIIVYPADAPERVILSMRFMVVENLISIVPHFKFSDMVGKREEFQQIGFELFYDQMDIQLPQNEISVMIRQNQRWDNTKYDIKALYYNLGENQMDFRYFDNTTNFPGWNEFRNFAFRNLNFTESNVKEIDAVNRKIILYPLKSRQIRSYVNFIDINGDYIIDNNFGNAILSADYFNVQIEFPSERLDGEYFLKGNFNSWNETIENQFTYDAELKSYILNLDLKQGYYDYLVEYKPGKEELFKKWHFEGSYYEAQNEYEVFVYYKKIGSRNDRIIGYLRRNFFE